MKRSPTISIVVPVYNEQDSIPPLWERICEACEALPNSFEVVFVDDGSQDRTFQVLEKIHREDTRVKVVRFRKNYGQTAAMAAGFQHASGEIIISMDADLQNDPADIPTLLEKLQEGYDLVCGWRKDRKDKLISRRIPSVIANWLIGRITGVPIHDNGCSLKAYRATVIKRVALYSELHRFIPAMSSLAGARIAEIVVHHHPRQFGKSKYGITRAWRVFSDLFVIKMLTGFAARPGLWFGILSVSAGLLGMVCMLAMLMAAFPGVVFSAIAFLTISLAGHFVVMGLIGEMVLHTGDFRPDRMLARSTIREIRIERGLRQNCLI